MREVLLAAGAALDARRFGVLGGRPGVRISPRQCRGVRLRGDWDAVHGGAVRASGSSGPAIHGRAFGHAADADRASA